MEKIIQFSEWIEGVRMSLHFELMALATKTRKFSGQVSSDLEILV